MPFWKSKNRKSDTSSSQFGQSQPSSQTSAYSDLEPVQPWMQQPSPSPPINNSPYQQSPHQSPPPQTQYPSYQHTQQPTYQQYPQQYPQQHPHNHQYAQQGPPQTQQQQQQQNMFQQVIVNVPSQYSSQPTQQQQTLPGQQVVPRCQICRNQGIRKVTAETNQKGNAGRCYWRCNKCNRWMVWDDEIDRSTNSPYH